MAVSSAIIHDLNERCWQLGMSHAAVARLSGVSLPTVQRILGKEDHDATVSNLLAIAEALGLGLDFQPEVKVDALREQQARRKAERLVAMVQGLSALEGQAVDQDTYERMVQRTVYELLAGPNRKLWAA